MGSSSSSPIANLMEFVLDNGLIGVLFYIPLMKRYVDDIICSVPEDKVTYLLNKFNSQHNRIQFTLEEETNRSVPFLDTRVIRASDNKLILDWYQKPSASGRYLHYLSNHTHSQKVNMVLGLKNRILRISHHSLRQKNLRLLHQLMMENGYPRNLLNRLIYNSNSSPPERQRNGDTSAFATTDVNLLYSSIPLVKGLTNALISLLRTSNVRLIPRSEFKIDKLFSRTKERINTMNKSGVVYLVPCSVCEEVYIGQTSQQLKKRLTQHKSDIKNPKKICALADHTRNRDHLMDYDSVQVLDCERNGSKRCFLEMYHIIRQVNSMNYRRDINNISSIYTYLIRFGQLSESEVARPLSGAEMGTLDGG
ncbi:uncharacterized protein LOC123317727 [Coccinella septempunctata]|uniref:uncharacterized protein LOC123317727 n=1 Tax=Coccinella septempunctata TaxID=41139 RepID=UPI001D084AF6|nr:uncharacterized protein LOC123317727 [Coccinella septempunctata]